jgi:flagellar FliJ protein
MKRFAFRYQTVLDVRERLEKQEEDLLQRLLGRQRAEEAERDRLVAEEASLREAWTERVSGALDLDALLTMHTSLDGMARRIAKQRQAVEVAKARTDNQREILTKAMQEAEVLRKLKQRDFDAWRLAIDRAENAAIDEMATLRHTRRAF